MKEIIFTLLILTFGISLFAQNITGSKLIANSITYHDPNGHWEQQELFLNLRETRPGSADRITQIQINLSEEYFKLDQLRNEDKIIREVSKTICLHKLNGSRKISTADIEKYRLSCERSKTIRDYYTYLWGLPMKLKDPGTIVDEVVVNSTFQGKTCYKLKVTYDPQVGEDIWYFYFDTTTFALIGYQFFHVEADNDGEYITLEGEETINGIRFPKKRGWYVNKDNEFLGADILESN